jgi:hypothetical protein
MSKEGPEWLVVYFIVSDNDRYKNQNYSKKVRGYQSHLAGTFRLLDYSRLNSYLDTAEVSFRLRKKL